MANEWARSTFTVDASGSGHTPQNVVNGFTSFLTQTGWVVPAWSTDSLDRYFVRSDHATSDVWWYNGDGTTQKCGIRIRYVAGNSRFEISCFVENTSVTGSQVTTRTAHVAFLTWDSTAPNNFLVIGGEHGLYWEDGRDGSPINLGHGFVGTQLPIPEFYDPRTSAQKWISQGFVCDLVGSLKCSDDRSFAFVVPDGTSRCFTARLTAAFARGSYSAVASSPVNDLSLGLSNRAAWFGHMPYSANVGTQPYFLYTLAVPWSPVNGRYSVSGLLCVNQLNITTSDSAHPSSVTNGAGVSSPTATPNRMCTFDPRTYLKQVRRFGAADYTLLGFSNVQDSVTSVVYRIAKFADNGRATNAAVEWPATVVTSTI